MWEIEWDGKSKVWKQDNKIRLKHKDTGVYLFSMDGAKFGHPINGQQEICGVHGKKAGTEWHTAEGVFLPSPEAEAAAAAAGEASNDEL